MATQDANKEAVKQVETVTDSEPVCGEDLLESDELKRQLREAKSRDASSSAPESLGN